MQKRAPNVATAHSMMSSAGASSSSAPTWETIALSSSVLRPSVSEPRRARAASVVGAVMTATLPAADGTAARSSTAGTRAGTTGTPRRRGRRPAVLRHRRATQGHAARGSRPRSRGSGTARPARSQVRLRLEDLLAAQQDLVGADGPGGEALTDGAVGQVVLHDRGDVVVE